MSRYHCNEPAALNITPDSQVLVYSPTSFQASKITQQNPRALYFNDSVYVAWVPGSNHVEFASMDPKKGAVFYTLNQAGLTTTIWQRLGL